MKSCRACKKGEPEVEFNKSSRDGSQSLCKGCQSNYSKGWQKQNRDKNIGYCQRYYRENKHKWRERDYKRKYGMTIQEVEALVASQNGRCPICDIPFKSQKLMSLDHDHKTGQLRQVLCSKCNTALGLLNEDVAIFHRAVEYINKWRITCVQLS